MADQSQPALFEEPTLTVAELNAGIGNAVRRAFPTDVWVRGEITDLSRPASGHVYFDLRGDGCSIPVTLWAADKAVVNAVLKRAGGAVRFTDGTEVRIRAQITWWAERGRVSLRMLSIDTAFTLGRLAEARELLVQRLRHDGLLDRQRALAFPLVPLRVGLVTSAGSAAEADFMRTLETSGLRFHVTLADARVQGVEAASSVGAALAALHDVTPDLDVICVVRGGGAKTDLAAFDLEAVALAIAEARIPVLTGIGHETDVSVADMVAHRAFKTPTACAAALVDAVATFRDRVDDAGERLLRAARAATVLADTRLHRASGRATSTAKSHLRAQTSLIDAHERRVRERPGRALGARAAHLEHVAARVRTLDPAHALARGWSITRDANGRLVRSIDEAPPGAAITTTVADGQITSTVTHG